MGKNTKELYGADAKGDLLYFAPERLTIVTDPKHELYDKRIHLSLNEALVRNIMHHGVLKSILIRKNGDAIEVVDGRQRVRNCEEANRRLVAKGSEPHRVPCITKRGDATLLMGMLISANAHSQEDGPLEKAEKAQRYLDLGRSIEEVEVIMGRDASTIKGWLALLEMPKDVREAVAANKIPASAAAKIAKLPAEKRAGAIEKKAATKGTRVRAKKPPKTEVKGLVKRLRASSYDGGYLPSSFAADVLEYTFGLTNREEFEAAHPEIFK